jgi:cobalt/nickel transport system ATP-binding protein
LCNNGRFDWGAALGESKMNRALISLRNVGFAYLGRSATLQALDLDLYPGERLCISGPNGAGKSTLLHIIVGLLKPTTGTVEAFEKMRIAEKDFHDVRRRAGLVFQDPDDQLFCPTVQEDIAFGPLNIGKSKTETAAIVEQVLERFGLMNLKERITHKLSGGEKRLVTLAAVMAMEPEVLLLDEPSNGLDEETTDRLVEILVSLPQSMILISHDAHFRAKIATRSLSLVDGHLEGFDPKCRHAKA